MLGLNSKVLEQWMDLHFSVFNVFVSFLHVLALEYNLGGLITDADVGCRCVVVGRDQSVHAISRLWWWWLLDVIGCDGWSLLSCFLAQFKQQPLYETERTPDFNWLRFNFNQFLEVTPASLVSQYGLHPTGTSIKHDCEWHQIPSTWNRRRVKGEGFTVKRWGMKSAAGEILLMEDVNHSSLTNNLKFS